MAEEAEEVGNFRKLQPPPFVAGKLEAASAHFVAAKSAAMPHGLDEKTVEKTLTNYFMRFFLGSAAVQATLRPGLHQRQLEDVCDVVVPEPAAAAASSGGSSGGSGDSVGGAAAAAGANGAAARVAAALAKVERHRWAPKAKRVRDEDAINLAKGVGPVLLPLSVYRAVLAELAPVLRPGAIMLDTPCGSGYLSVVASYLVEPAGYVAGEEPLEQVADFALKCLEKEPGHLARFELGLVKLHRGDGLHGYNGVLFDAIAVTAKCDDATLARYASMLRPGGRLVAFRAAADGASAEMLAIDRVIGNEPRGSGGLACRVVLGGVKCVLRNAAPLDVWKLYRERLAADSAVRLGSYPFATEAQPVYEEINAEYPGVRCLCHTPPARCRRSKETTRR